MDGYKIIYVDKLGGTQETFIGLPMSSGMGDFDNEIAIRSIFSFAHPGCKIIGLSFCGLNGFKHES